MKTTISKRQKPQIQVGIWTPWGVLNTVSDKETAEATRRRPGGRRLLPSVISLTDHKQNSRSQA